MNQIKYYLITLRGIKFNTGGEDIPELPKFANVHICNTPELEDRISKFGMNKVLVNEAVELTSKCYGWPMKESPLAEISLRYKHPEEEEEETDSDHSTDGSLKGDIQELLYFEDKMETYMRGFDVALVSLNARLQGMDLSKHPTGGCIYQLHCLRRDANEPKKWAFASQHSPITLFDLMDIFKKNETLECNLLTEEYIKLLVDKTLIAKSEDGEFVFEYTRFDPKTNQIISWD